MSDDEPTVADILTEAYELCRIAEAEIGEDGFTTPGEAAFLRAARALREEYEASDNE